MCQIVYNTSEKATRFQVAIIHSISRDFSEQASNYKKDQPGQKLLLNSAFLTRYNVNVRNYLTDFLTAAMFARDFIWVEQ